MIYVMDAEPGKYVADSLLTDGSFMPVKWKHGYSKGIALSDEKQAVIYWIIVW